MEILQIPFRLMENTAYSGPQGLYFKVYIDAIISSSDDIY